MRRIPILFLGACFVVFVALGPAEARPAPVQRFVPAQSEGLLVDATTTYRLDLAAGVIAVTVEARLTNTMPSTRRGNVISTPYFDSFAVGAIGPIDGVRARRDGTTLSTSIEGTETPDVQFAVADLSPNLVHGSPQTVVIDYLIPAQPVRSDFATRINDAYASWFVNGTGDDGTIDVVVDVPSRFDLLHDGGESDRETVGDRTIHRFTGLGLDESFFAVSAEDDDRLVSRETEVGDVEVRVDAWPGDEGWADFAIDAAERGLPELEDLTGLELEDDRSITIAETATPYVFGYAGWYYEGLDLIEVGDELDVQIMLHELSHVWFNNDLFASRWINEGLAEVVSNRIAPELGGEALPVPTVDLAAPGAQPLNSWEVPGTEEDAEAIEGFGYGAAYAVMHELVEEIGDDGLRELLRLADAGRIVDAGDRDPEAAPSTDWEYLYDLATLELGSETIEDLFRTYVLTPDEIAALDERDEMRTRYGELAEAGGEWAPPLQVRRYMGTWNWDQAATAIEEAEAILDQRSELVEILDGTSVELPAALEERYETTQNLGSAAGLADDFVAAATDLAEVDDQASSANPLARLGFLGSGLDGHLDAAEDAFDTGEFGRMERSLAAAQDEIDGATAGGALRLVAVAAVVGLGVVLLRLRRSRRRIDEDPEPTWDDIDFRPTP